MEIQLLFVDFRGSSHVVLEWLCFLRDDVAPGSVRRILSRVDLHVISRLLLFFIISCRSSCFLRSLFSFYGLQGPARSAILIRTFFCS